MSVVDCGSSGSCSVQLRFSDVVILNKSGAGGGAGSGSESGAAYLIRHGLDWLHSLGDDDGWRDERLRAAPVGNEFCLVSSGLSQLATFMGMAADPERGLGGR